MTTFSLVVHSLADGFALGSATYASGASSSSSLEIIVFLALMLHKLPAALGLTTFLMHERQSQTTIARHLLSFTASSPLASIATYFGFLWLSEEKGPGVLVAVGMFMLVSAGTFLYVAIIHILPEVYCNTTIHRPH